MDKDLKRKLELPFFGRKKANNDANAKTSKEEFNLGDLPTDPGLRIPILNYNPNIRDQVRRHYMQMGPCQPRHHDFPKKKCGQAFRIFNPDWFDDYNWLEYSIEKDAVFCLWCYLFRPTGGKKLGNQSFVIEGFSNWRKIERLSTHVGHVGSKHNQARRNCEALMNQKQHIETIISKQSSQVKKEYRTRLETSVVCVRYLLRQGLAFRGHYEYLDSTNQGNFLELLRFAAYFNDDVRIATLKNAPENLKLTSPDIQKDIINAAAVETTNIIIKDIGDSLFSILVDESRDISTKEQMAIVLRYVDKNGHVIERFIGIEHVPNTTALSLKAAIDKLFSRYGLSISRLRGQGYDGASNMQGEFNGLKALILKENPCAFYIHCFAHQLQLALVAVARRHIQIDSLFFFTSSVVNVVSGSSKRCDILQDNQIKIVAEALENGEISRGRGLNQNTSLKRSGDTRWGSHYGTLMSLITMFSSTIKVIETIVEDGSSEQRFEAKNLLETMQSFDFIFSLHLMRTILGVTNELSRALQREDQDILNAMCLVKICKQQLQNMRENGWDYLLDKVSSFCKKNDINIPKMDDIWTPRGRSRRKSHEITNLHFFRVELFYSVIDMQLQELNNRFNEVNTELLVCMSCLSPIDLFYAFDKEKLIRFAEFYPDDFSAFEILALDDQLETYIVDMRTSKEFGDLKGIGDLTKKMVETRKNRVYFLVYRLLNLALVLPVATATVERSFSAMNIVKNKLRNRMGDQLINDSLVVYIEKEICDAIDNETIMLRFQNMKTRRGEL
ncbi:uncharacterized protein LOC133780069 [Humulus lupulus]|uniref:uncharacterized protein LOC133780069 n=1 Tax=Humulus lupulus TaxID=3486 RepID=UPI002B4166A0|nr:uncharacterized protein LOC133780069 [Humulus lupulus]